MSDNINYTVIEDDIHVFTLLNAKRQTLDDIFAVIAKLDQEIPKSQTFRLIFDACKTPDIPMRYTIQKSEQWKKSQDQLHTTRTAVIASQQTVMLALVNVLVGIFNTTISKTKLFTPDQWDEAIAWAKADD